MAVNVLFVATWADIGIEFGINVLNFDVGAGGVVDEDGVITAMDEVMGEGFDEFRGAHTGVG